MLKRIACLVLASALAACGGPLKYDLKGTQLSPGSDAHVVATVDRDRNVTNLEVEAKNLTPAERLVDGGKTYVVWARKNSDAQWARVGALELEGDGRIGKAKLSVPETEFDMAITAEKEAGTASPSGKVVFEQRVAK